MIIFSMALNILQPGGSIQDDNIIKHVMNMICQWHFQVKGCFYTKFIFFFKLFFYF